MGLGTKILIACASGTVCFDSTFEKALEKRANCAHCHRIYCQRTHNGFVLSALLCRNERTKNFERGIPLVTRACAFQAQLYTASGQIRDALNSNLKDVVDSAGKPEKRGETLRIVSVWWWMLPAVGIPLWVGGLLALLLVGAGIGIISAGAFVK